MLQRKRIVFMLLAIGISMLLLGIRLIYLQSVQSDALRTRAVNVRTRVVPVQARRGDILDRNGEVLADSVDVYSVFANPSLIADKPAVAARLAPILDLPEATLLKRLQTRTLFIWLRRRVSDTAAAAVRAADITGIQLARESRRVFPEGTLAAQVLGFSGIDNQGLAGVEYEYNAQLQGTAGEMISEYDARNHPIPRAQQQYVPPVDGLTLQLTIDARLQLDAERELARAVAAHGAIGGSVLIMDPQTGAILALANQPTFDPGDPTAAPQSRWRDFVVSDTMSPGSVFKPITAAAGIQSGVVSPGSGFFDAGFLRVGGWTIHNAGGEALGPTTFAQGFAHSANVVLAQLGLRVGVARFYQFLDAFGLLGRTGVDLPGEARGIVPAQARVKPIDLAVMSFGQTLTVTPIAMATAVATVANGGSLMWPHVGKELIAPDGKVVERIEPKVLGHPISAATAAAIRRMMMAVVTTGTGKRAQIPGYDVAGKTGTTNKVVAGRVSKSTYIGSFLGYLPAERPRVLIYVIINEPQGTPYGGYVAAPVFRSLALDAIHLLDIPPQHPNQVRRGGAQQESAEVRVPSLLNLAAGDARTQALAAGLNFAVRGGMDARVREQVPPAGTLVAPGTTLVVFTAPRLSEPSAETALVTVPDLGGLSIKEAGTVLAQLDLVLEADGTGRVVEQDPAPGTTLPAGSVVHVTCE